MFVIEELKEDICKSLVESGQNVMVTGPTGSGKTKFCLELSDKLDMKTFVINCGSTQDARISLLGSFELVNGETKFIYSPFLQAIQQENTLIILDELSRASDDAYNILFPLLDFRKSIKVEETGETINISDSVKFIATANIGSEYSATRSIDRALADRFLMFNLDYIDGKSLSHYCEEVFNLDETQKQSLYKTCQVYDFVLKLYQDDELSTRISPRTVISCLDLFKEFSFTDVFNTVVISYFNDDTSVSSEVNTIRMFMDSKGIQ